MWNTAKQSIINASNEINNTVVSCSDDSLKGMDYNDLFLLELRAKEIMSMVHSVIEIKEDDIKDAEEKYKIDAEQNNNIGLKIECDNKKISISTPYIFKRSYGGNYDKTNFIYADLINKQLKKWIEYNNYLVEKCEIFNSLIYPNYEKMVVVITRKSKIFTVKSICDNDNIEAGRIINTIFSNINRADNAQKMSIYINYVESQNDEEGTIFTIIKESEFINNTNLYVEK